MGKRLLPLVCLLLGAGCDSGQYEIEVTPQGEKFERQLTAWKHVANTDPNVRSLPDEELKAIAAQYKQPVPTPVERKHTFRGQFATRTPIDVGGYGSYIRYDSPCGVVTAYLERFRGSDDLIGAIEARSKSIDTTIELLIGWCESEVGKDPDFPKLREFLNTNLRRDLKNLSVYVYSLGFGFAESDQAQKEIVARVIQYLLERNYLPPQDVPLLARAFTDINSRENPRTLNELLVRIVARKMGVAGNTPPAMLGFLADPEKAQDSLKKYLRTTDAYQRSKGRGEENKTDGELDPLSLVQEPLGLAFIPNGIFSGADHVSLTLACPREPFKTNGKWDKEKVRLTWEAAVETTDVKAHEIPKLFFASWAEPNATYQEDHFGRVVLDGEDLAQYCLWYRGLTTPERNEWSNFVGNLKPGENLSGQLIQFRFPGEKPAASSESIDSKSLAAPAVQLITTNLTATKEGQN